MTLFLLLLPIVILGNLIFVFPKEAKKLRTIKVRNR